VGPIFDRKHVEDLDTTCPAGRSGPGRRPARGAANGT